MEKSKFSKVILLGGNNFDKKQLMTVQKKILRDLDIKKLLNQGHFGWRLPILFTIFLVLLFHDVTDFFSKILSFYSFQLSNYKDEAMLFTISLIIWNVVNMKNTIRTKTKEVFNFFTYFRYIVLGKAPRMPGDLWTSLNANISDAQAVKTAMSTMGKSTSFIYTGQPYFKTKAIDSITLQWDKKFSFSGKGFFFDYFFLYKRLFKEHAVETVTGYADNAKYLLEQRKLKTSTSVFGILFSSKVLRKLYIKYGCPIHLKIDEEMSTEVQKWAKEFVQLSTSRSMILWDNEETGNSNEESQETCSLSIVSIDFLSEDNGDFDEKNLHNNMSRNFLKYHLINFMNIFKGRVRIPVKKFIALPTENLPITPKEKQLVISLGGAEQNLGLTYFVNQHRWHPASLRQIGIAETEADDQHYTRFQIGTESLVYGINKKMQGREIDKKNQTKAEVFSFPLENLLFVSVYGYSAPLTKMAIQLFLQKLSIDRERTNVEQTQEEYSEAFLPWKSMDIKNILTYQLQIGEDEELFSSSAMKEWDSLDAMNLSNTDFFEKNKFTVS